MKAPAKKKTPEEKSYEAIRTEVEKHNAKFRKDYSPKLKAWMDTFPGRAAPVVTDKDGRMYWLDRKQRKKFGNKNKTAFGKNFFNPKVQEV